MLGLVQIKTRYPDVSQVKLRSPQNISGASQQNRVAAFMKTTEVYEYKT